MSSSFKHYYEEQSGSSLTFNRPVDTFATLVAMDNVSHLVDVAPVYRVNWVTPRPVLGYIVEQNEAATTMALSIAHEFPIHILREWRYPNFDVRVAASVTSGETMAMVARLSSTAAPYNSDLSDPDVLGLFVESTTSATPDWYIDGQVESDGRNTPLSNDGILTNLEIGDNSGKTAGAYIVKARLTVQLRAIFSSFDINTDNVKLHGIQVREYVNAD